MLNCVPRILHSTQLQMHARTTLGVQPLSHSPQGCLCTSHCTQRRRTSVVGEEEGATLLHKQSCGRIACHHWLCCSPQAVLRKDCSAPLAMLLFTAAVPNQMHHDGLALAVSSSAPSCRLEPSHALCQLTTKLSLAGPRWLPSWCSGRKLTCVCHSMGMGYRGVSTDASQRQVAVASVNISRLLFEHHHGCNNVRLGPLMFEQGL